MSERETLDLHRDDVVILFKRMLLLQAVWSGGDLRVYNKLRDWLRRQRQLDRVDENCADEVPSQVTP